MHVCMSVYVTICVCILDGGGSKVFASTALVVILTAMYLTSY